MPTGVHHHTVERARKLAAENPQTTLVNLVACDTNLNESNETNE